MYFKLAVTCCHSESFTNSICLKSKDINFTKSQIILNPRAAVGENISVLKKKIIFLQQDISIYHQIIIMSEAFSLLQKLSRISDVSI